MSAGTLRGDEADLFRRHNAPLVRCVRRIVNAPDALIEDACSTAWMQLIRTQPDRGPALFAWLRTVAVHEAYTLSQKQRRDAWLEELPGDHSVGEGWEGLVQDPVDPDTHLEARGALSLLASLRPRQRDYLSLLVAGYTYQEIVRLTGATYTNVNKHLSRARASVRAEREAA